MATITVGALANELATEAGENYSDVQIAALFIKWVQEGYVAITSTARYAWLNTVHNLNTVNGTAEYTLPATIAEIKVIRNSTTDVGIGYNAEEDLVALGKNLEETGSPSAWWYSGLDATTTGLKITFWPIPNAVIALKVHGITRPASLSSTDVIPLGEDFIRLIRIYVRAQVMYNEVQIQEYAATLQNFTTELDVLVARYSQPRRSSSRLKVRNLPRTGQAPAASSD